ncbi:MAG: hypothetical protein HYZ26_06125 [Chloroflexi bacterium]|nr:hypothetical protein [Chloroflexota bacterium]
MRTWNLGPGEPQCLTLAADWRLSPIDYANDHIWELALGRGDPAAILLHGSYGLRARDLRLFPRFTEGALTLSDPAAFDTPPRLAGFAPNWLRLAYAPFPGIELLADYWAPGGPLLAGRIQVTNAGVTRRRLRLDLVALLSPIGPQGEAMLPVRREAVHILQGRTHELWPVLFFTGGPEGVRSPYPALSQELDMLPGAARRFTWVLASLPDAEEGFRLARQTAARNWEAELARIQMVNAAALEVATGEPDWDAAFALGQSQANSLLLSPTSHLPYASFVSARQPDHGYSPRGDGGDYSHIWNGQTALEAWYLAQNLLPGSPDAAKGLVRNFLAAQSEDGRVDFKPGLGGQRGRMLATPLLADLAWRIYQHSDDLRFLEEVFPRLLDFVQAWFAPRQDRDGDGVPEWDHPTQTGFDDNPLFSPWHAWAQGVDIRSFESPDLCAFLYNECQALIHMAAALGRPEPAAGLAALTENLRTALETAWDGRAATYRYWDREAHNSQKGETLGRRKGPGQIPLDLVFDLPQRLAVRLETRGAAGVSAQVYVHGTLPSGQHRVEKLNPSAFQWLGGRATVTLDPLFMELDHIQVDGLPPNGSARATLVDFRAEDHTLLTPLWAGLPDPGRAAALIDRKLLKGNAYGQPFGLPACLKAPARPEAETLHAAWLPWNVMAAEGLLRYGRRAEAAALLGKLMNAITANLKREQAFRRCYHAGDGRGLGERNSLLGLPPLGLFLQILGVRILSPWKVVVDGLNPFPWPVRIQYRGLTLECLETETVVTFPDGQSVSVEEAGPHLASVA